MCLEIWRPKLGNPVYEGTKSTDARLVVKYGHLQKTLFSFSTKFENNL